MKPTPRDLTQIPAYHDTVKNLRQLIRPLVESQGLSQLHGHGLWLVCEGSLKAALHLEAGSIWWYVFLI